MLNQFSREELLIGKENLEKIKKAKVAVFGIGGVGSFAVEGLVRAGVQNFVLVDNDTISLTNINRQIHADFNTIGKYKVDVMKKRILAINPQAKVETYKTFYEQKNNEINLGQADYIVDAIDTVASKIDLIVTADKLQIPIISCMGTGNKLEPTEFEVTDIYKTKVCPLAKAIRKQLRIKNIKKLKVVYSKEEPIKIDKENIEENIKAGSISFVPSVAGLIIAGEVVKDIIIT